MSKEMFYHPIVKIGVADSRRRYYDFAAGGKPFFLYDRMGELGKQGKLYSTTFEAGALKQFGMEQTTHCITVDRQYLKGTMLRPYLRQPVPWARADGTPTRRWGVETVPNPTGGLWGDHTAGEVINDFWDFFLFHPNNQDNWDFTLQEDGLLYEFTQKVAYTGDGSHTSDWTISQVGFDGTELMYDNGEDQEDNNSGIWQGLTPNPFFTAGFRRAALPPEYLEATVGSTTTVDVHGKEIDLTKQGVGWTQIIWGMNPQLFPNGKWMLDIPVTGRPTLYEMMNTSFPWALDNQQFWQARPWTEGNLNEINQAKAAKDGYTYHIGTIGNAICVGEAAFDSDQSFAYYCVPNADQPIVPWGSMVMRNYPGQCTFWLDFNLFTTGEVGRWPFEIEDFRLADMNHYIHGQPFSRVINNMADPEESIVDSLPQTEGMGVWVSKVGLEETMPGFMRYNLSMTPSMYPGAADPAAEVVTMSVPLVEAVTVFQNPDLTMNGPATFTETPRLVSGLETTAEMEDAAVSHHTLVVDNRLETFTAPSVPIPAGGLSPTYNFTIGRQLQLTQVGWKNVSLETYELFDELVSLGEYWIVSGQRRSKEARFVVTCLLGMLALEQWEGEGDLCFRGWTQYDAIAFGLEYQGIGPNQYDLEDTGLVVVDNDRQKVKRGTSWLKVYQSLLDQGGTIWYDWTDGKVKTGCRFCRTKRTAATLMDHIDAGWNSSGCLAADVARAGATGIDYVCVENTAAALATDPYTKYIIADGSLDIDEVALDSKDYANSITVTGKLPYGEEGWSEIIARYRNPVALDPAYVSENDYVGFVVSKTAHDERLTTAQAVVQRTAEWASRLTAKPIRCRFKIPLLSALRPGMVVQIEGAKWASAHQKKFRVTGVKHDPRDAMTEVYGRQMLGLPEEDE